MLVLLPTSTSKLLAQWQGPYRVIRGTGKVNYLVDMHDRRKQHRVFHVNMLKWWPPAWNDGGDGEPTVGEGLMSAQRRELEKLYSESTVRCCRSSRVYHASHSHH